MSVCSLLELWCVGNSRYIKTPERVNEGREDKERYRWVSIPLLAFDCIEEPALHEQRLTQRLSWHSRWMTSRAVETVGCSAQGFNLPIRYDIKTLFDLQHHSLLKRIKSRRPLTTPATKRIIGPPIHQCQRSARYHCSST